MNASAHELLYDVHTHVGVDLGFVLRGWWPYAETSQGLIQHMDAHAIGRAVCFPFVLSSAYDPYAFGDRGAVELLPDRVPYDRENLLLCEEGSRIDTDRRLMVFAMFDPSRKTGLQLANLERLTGRIAGLKTQSTIIESPIRALLHESRGLMAFAEQHDLPVLFHTAVFPDDCWAQVETCLEIAAAYPRIRFNLAHSLRFHAPHLAAAARLPNVWVDCAAHLAHCQLAREDHPAVAPRCDRVDADYANPAQVLEAVFDLLDGCYLWGSDNPFMSWCDKTIRAVYSYGQEAQVLMALPAAVRTSMAATAPKAWLGMSN